MSPTWSPRLTSSLAFLVAMGVFASCSGLEETGDKGYISGSGRIIVYPDADRGIPVKLAGDSLEGDPLDVADFRGQVVVVNLWWSGCAPCRTEMPLLARVAEDHREAEFVGINIRDASESGGLAFQAKVGVPYPSIYSPDGQATLAFSGIANVVAVPTTILLDRRGRPAAVFSGAVPSELTLRELIEDVENES